MTPRARRAYRKGRRAGGTLVIVAFGAAPWVGCGGSRVATASSSAGADARAVTCALDEVRQYFCDELLPRESSRPAPPPYDTCPSSVENPPGEYDPPVSVGLFDRSYTEYTRRRAPPGHACCYSWCRKITLANGANPSIDAACHTGKAFREEYCMAQLETGTSAPAEPPFDHCPTAIVPPRKVVFSAPESAPFDAALTASHRGKGEPDCCYAWCSQAPAGSDLLKTP